MISHLLNFFNTVAPEYLVVVLESDIATSPHAAKLPHKVLSKIRSRMSDSRILLFAPDWPAGFQYIGVVEYGSWKRGDNSFSHQLMAHEVDPPFGKILMDLQSDLFEIYDLGASSPRYAATALAIKDAATKYLSAARFSETLGRAHIFYTDGSYEPRNSPGQRLGLCSIETNATGEIQTVIYSQHEYFTTGDECLRNHIAEICAVRETFRWIHDNQWDLNTVTLVCDNFNSAKTMAGMFKPSHDVPVLPECTRPDDAVPVRWVHIYSHDSTCGAPPSFEFYYNELADLIAGKAVKPLAPDAVIELIYSGASAYGNGAVPYKGTRLRVLPQATSRGLTILIR